MGDRLEQFTSFRSASLNENASPMVFLLMILIANLLRSRILIFAHGVLVSEGLLPGSSSSKALLHVAHEYEDLLAQAGLCVTDKFQINLTDESHKIRNCLLPECSI